VPATQADLLRLPGVGEHTTAAVLCFGWDGKVIFLDSATKRLAARLSGRDCSSAWTTRLELYRLAGTEGPDRAFNLAIRSLTAAHCARSRPRCMGCPVSEVCRSKAVAGVG
jgi:A/G-specific adenine glycosylase